MTLSQREAFARTMEHLCNHDSHGYTQGNRWGNWHKETVDLGDGVRVEVMLGDRDCSSAIISALRAVGIDTHDATYTGNMKRNILESGHFVWYGINDFSAQRGDIYLNEQCHTAMCTSAYGSAQGDILAEFSISENGTAYGNEGDQTGWESHICAYYDYPWDGILHWKDDGDTLGEEEDMTPEQSAKLDEIYNVVKGIQYQTTESDSKDGCTIADRVFRLNKMLKSLCGIHPESTSVSDIPQEASVCSQLKESDEKNGWSVADRIYRLNKMVKALCGIDADSTDPKDIPEKIGGDEEEDDAPKHAKE